MRQPSAHGVMEESFKTREAISPDTKKTKNEDSEIATRSRVKLMRTHSTLKTHRTNITERDSGAYIAGTPHTLYPHFRQC